MKIIVKVSQNGICLHNIMDIICEAKIYSNIGVNNQFWQKIVECWKFVAIYWFAARKVESVRRRMMERSAGPFLWEFSWKMTFTIWQKDDENINSLVVLILIIRQQLLFNKTTTTKTPRTAERQATVFGQQWLGFKLLASCLCPPGRKFHNYRMHILMVVVAMMMITLWWWWWSREEHLLLLSGQVW